MLKKLITTAVVSLAFICTSITFAAEENSSSSNTNSTIKMGPTMGPAQGGSIPGPMGPAKSMGAPGPMGSAQGAGVPGPMGSGKNGGIPGPMGPAQGNGVPGPMGPAQGNGVPGPMGTPQADPQTQGNLSPGQVTEVQKIVRDYLLQNPQIMVQVFQKLQQQQRTQMEKRALSAISANEKEIFNNAESPVAGNKNGSISLVEFFDYQCPHCKIMAKVVENAVNDDKDLKVIFKEFPIFPGSMYAAQAALASQKQGKYYEFHNALMADKNPLSKEDVLATAKRVGLNVSKLKKDMNSNAIKNELKQNVQLAEKLGLAGTPAFIIQNNADKKKTFFVPGQISMNVLQQLIQKAS